MTLIVLTATCLLACAFYVYVLCKWMRDTNSKRTRRPPIHGQNDGEQENKRLYVMGSRKIAERGDRSDVTSHRSPSVTGPSRRRGIAWNECERIAYRQIANSLSSRNRS